MTTRLHSEIGERTLRWMCLPGCDQAATAIRAHHEHYDGRGYPDGLAGKDIPICSRIISVADSYDAMAITPSYHQPKKHHAILDIRHRETGVKQDPALVPLFVRVIDASPHRDR